MASLSKKDPLRFDGRTVVITGAGGGLGRAYSLAFSARGANVVVNDLASAGPANADSSNNAERVVAEIEAQGGTAVASTDSVQHGDRIIATAMDCFGRVDVLVNNAGILRDKSFHNMSDESWHEVLQVHLEGTRKTTQAAWPHMRDAGYGRVVMTTSSAGIFGNFGQANYAAAKLGVLGLAQTLSIEGANKGIYVNTVAPFAASGLTSDVFPEAMQAALKPEHIAPLVLWLCHERSAANGKLIEAGAGWYAALAWERARGLMLDTNTPIEPEHVETGWDTITSFSDSDHPTTVLDTVMQLTRAIEGKKLS